MRKSKKEELEDQKNKKAGFMVLAVVSAVFALVLFSDFTDYEAPETYQKPPAEQVTLVKADTVSGSMFYELTAASGNIYWLSHNAFGITGQYPKFYYGFLQSDSLLNKKYSVILCAGLLDQEVENQEIGGMLICHLEDEQTVYAKWEDSLPQGNTRSYTPLIFSVLSALLCVFAVLKIIKG